MPVTYQKPHSINAEDYARIIAQHYEPELNWDSPSDYDLLDRAELTENTEKFLNLLAQKGFVIQSLDDLALDEFN